MNNIKTVKKVFWWMKTCIPVAFSCWYSQEHLAFPHVCFFYQLHKVKSLIRCLCQPLLTTRFKNGCQKNHDWSAENIHSTYSVLSSAQTPALADSVSCCNSQRWICWHWKPALTITVLLDILCVFEKTLACVSLVLHVAAAWETRFNVHSQLW